MASYQRNTDRRYRAPVEGSLARKLDNLDRSGRMDFDELYERRPPRSATPAAGPRPRRQSALPRRCPPWPSWGSCARRF